MANEVVRPGARLEIAYGSWRRALVLLRRGGVVSDGEMAVALQLALNGWFGSLDELVDAARHLTGG
ncbi:hypothetical protein [Actinotalea solisilvae]|uniref:hypothetical protein n=1 Tax=Actinotalea solisilvae TaxID=2072922 RepID=UPI0018F271A2|nr:hypothetical protein [Actinotalea solisilvae]